MKNEIKSVYVPGSEWLYYKLYSGSNTADAILIKVIAIIANDLLKKGIIKSWFFIRYYSPEYHLRIRFHLTNDKHFNTLLVLMNKSLTPYIDNRLIWKILIDTYKRELKRYGTNTIALSEDFFHYDSKCILRNLSNLNNGSGRYLFAISHIYTILKLFNLNIGDSYHFTQSMRNAYKKEFSADKQTVKQLDKIYRNLKPDLNKVIITNYEGKVEFITSTLYIAQTIIDLNKHQKLQVRLDELLSSYIHMSINRIFQKDQRFSEYVCYEFLFKYLKTERFKQ